MVVRDGNSAENENKRCCLKSWEKDVVLNSIQNCLEQVATVLQNNDPKNYFVDFNFAPTDVRCLDLIKSRLLYTSEEKTLKDIETKAVLQKLKNDSTYLVDILEKTVQELNSSGSFSILSKIPKQLAEELAKESDVLFMARKNLENLKLLREIIAEEKHANELEKKEYFKKYSEARRELEILNVKGKASIRYVFTWEKARCKQNVERCNIAEKELRQSLEKLIIDDKNENCISRDIETFLLENIAKNEDEIIKWKNRYDQNWTEYSNEIGRLQKQINMEKTVLEKLKEEQRVKQNFIDTYLAEKEADRKKKEHEKHVRKSIIKIQSWWRGVMVRRKLGSYRPEEKKKKKPNKTKK